jgi:hypothetical protein
MTAPGLGMSTEGYTRRRDPRGAGEVVRGGGDYLGSFDDLISGE